MVVQVVSLAEDLLKGLAPELASSVTLVFGDVEAALLASTKVQNQVVALDDEPEEPLVGPLLIVEPSAGQVLLAQSDSRSNNSMPPINRMNQQTFRGFFICSWGELRSC